MKRIGIGLLIVAVTTACAWSQELPPPGANPPPPSSQLPPGMDPGMGHQGMPGMHPGMRRPEAPPFLHIPQCPSDSSLQLEELGRLLEALGEPEKALAVYRDGVGEISADSAISLPKPPGHVPAVAAEAQ